MSACTSRLQTAACLRHRLVLVAARSNERRPGGGGAKSGSATRQFTIPDRLVNPGISQESGRNTVYTVRLSTGMSRGAALSDPAAGVLVCLLASDGAALLRRLPRLNDPELSEQEVRDICASIDEKEAGANCALALHAAATQRQSGAGPRLRFQEGAVDEISFCGPELGPLAALLVGPESGGWLCEEVDVSSSRTGHTDRFVCRTALGEGGQPAAYLRPVSPDSVVYGSGDAAVVVTKEQAARLYRASMAQYGELKGQLLGATAVMVALGSALAYAAGGRDLALPFALGGAGGLLYQYMLQVAADSVGAPAGSPYAQDSSGSFVGALLSNPGVRAVAAASLLLAVLTGLRAASGEQGMSAANFFQVQQIVAALVGFLCYKFAVVGVAIMPATEEDDVRSMLRADASSGGSGGDSTRDL